VQGFYRDDLETVIIEGECARCSKPFTITFDRDMNYRVEPADADLQVFIPLIDVKTLEAPNIIDDF
jgi:hypothetical protein